MVKMSVLGVMKAAATNTNTIATLRHRRRNEDFSTPILVKKKATIGNSNTKPIINNNPINVLIYEFSDI